MQAQLMYSRRQDTHWTQLSRWILTGNQSKGKLVFYLGKRHSLMVCSRCRGYKTLTLWTHHLGMRRMNRLATMECKREDTEMVSIFFQLFNEALAKHVGDENYKFNPSMICTDEAGAFLQAIRNVFGEEYLNRIVSFQWHFKQCAHRQLPNIRTDDQASFMFYVNRICTASTVAEYKLYASGLEEICKRNKCVK